MKINTVKSLGTKIENFEKKYSKIQKFGRESLSLLKEHINKFSYDSIILYTYSIFILLVAFVLNSVKTEFGARLAIVDKWDSFLSYRMLWKLLDNSSEEFSKFIFTVLNAIKDNTLVILGLIFCFFYLVITFGAKGDLNDTMIEQTLDMVSSYKFWRNFAFFLLNIYIFLKVKNSLSSVSFTKKVNRLLNLRAFLTQNENISVLIIFLGFLAIKNDNYIF